MDNKTTVNPKYLHYQTTEEVEKILDAVRPHTEITVEELMASTLSADTKAKLKAIRNEGDAGAVILISNGDTLIPTNIFAYSGTFAIYFTFVSGNANGLTAELVYIEANANSSRWTVTRRNLTADIDRKLELTDSDDPTSLIEE